MKIVQKNHTFSQNLFSILPLFPVEIFRSIVVAARREEFSWKLEQSLSSHHSTSSTIMAQSRSPADDMGEEEEEHEFFWTVQTSYLKTRPDDLKYRKITKSSSLECPIYGTGQGYPSAFGSIVSSSSQAWLHIKVKILVKDLVAKQDAIRHKYPNIPKTLMLSMLQNSDQKGDVTFRTKDG
ncbi:hypothetical protein Fcan01_26696 [Folsomia candida]|uniref:Uncharacterized protein n=1 Tax=Folsomia candida TaxID=158441 RepID=A0A226CYV8_FOLCA|nr:hypothetical protein Fcan01_26696 [Folsomia candida]